MRRPCRFRALFVFCALFALGLSACQGGGLSRIGSAGGGSGGGGRFTSAQVNLTDRDLEAVDAYLRAGEDQRNSQWILGDTVDIYASKEYFSQALTVNAKIGLVHRKDEKVGDDEIVTLTFIGHESQASAMANPRILIGTGITVSARRSLRLRMARTTNANVPVQLRVVAQGNASRGRKEAILARGPQLELGGSLRKTNGAWIWNEIGR